LSAWTSRCRPCGDLSAAANPHAALAAPRGIFVRRRFSPKGRNGSRRRIPSPSSTAFNRGSFHPSHTARHGDHPEGTFRWPLTSCAHRLRKPDRTNELLALSVARWPRRCGLRPAATSTPKGGLQIAAAPFRGTPRPDTFHRARLTVVAVGLERRPPDEPERLPSARLEPCGPSGLSRACCSRAQPRPAPCRLLRAWVCLVKGRLVASSYPALPRTALPLPARQRRVTTRERCVSPTSATDSRHEHPADCPIPGRTPCRPPPCSGSRFASCFRTRRERRLILGLSRAAARSGDLAIRLPDEPTRWSLA